MRLPAVRSHHFVAAGLLLVLVVGSLLLARPGLGRVEAKSMPSTWNSGDDGLLGLYMIAEGLDLPVERFEGPMETLDPVETPALVVAGDPADGEFAGALREWVASGGRLLLATRDEAVLGAFGLVASDGVAAPPVPTGRAMRWDLREGLPAVAARFKDAPAGHEPLLLHGDGAPCAVSFPLGSGSVVAVADPGLLSNAALRETEAPVLAVRLLEDLAPGEPVAFCETWLGFGGGGDPSSGLLRILARTPFGHAVLGASAFLALLLLAESKRFGRIRRDLEPPRRSEYEYLDALAGLFVATRAWAETGRLLLRGVQRRSMRGDARAGPRAAPELTARLAWDRPADADRIRAAVSALTDARDPATMAGALAVVDGALPPERSGESGDPERTPHAPR